MLMRSQHLIRTLGFLLLFAVAGCSQGKKEMAMPGASRGMFSSQVHGIAFQHAEKLSIEENAQGITVHHDVPFAHPDPCDFKGDGGDLTVLTDFHVVLRREKADMRDLLKDYSGVTFNGNAPIPEEGYIDEVTEGSLHGYRLTLQNEGCGQYEYYFPLGSKGTLVVLRTFVSEFMPTTFFYDEMHQQYESLPGVILPPEEEKLFEHILLTTSIL